MPPAERAALLDDACAGDEGLRRELEELLAVAPEAEGFFGRFADAVASLDVPLGPADPLIGSAFGRYQVEARLGAGGMGVVYRAFDARLQRVVALKLLSPYLGEDVGARKRFLTEARAAAALDHPNICTVYETGEAEPGIPYIAMAYCDGETLRARVARGAVPVDEAIRVALQMARGLAAAHARGVIHRDVKPANVMIAADGLVKLVDFGLARLTDVTLTAPALVRGTFAYMAPELLRGEPADARTDLWALGVVLYEMLTGTRPFRADSDAALLYAIAHERPERIERVQPEVPDSLADVVTRLLQDDPTLRYQGAAEVAQELEQLAGTPPMPTRHAVWLGSQSLFGVRGARRWLIPLAATAAVASVSFFAVRGDTTATPPGEARTIQLPAPRVAVLYFHENPPVGDVGDVSTALTDSLINALAAVPGLDVPSPSSVRRFRGTELSALGDRPDSLRAEWIVWGLITRQTDSIVITSEVSDSTGRLIDFRRIAHDDEQILIDEAVPAVAVMVREAIGVQQRARRWRAGTQSDLAIRLVEQALMHGEDAGALAARSQPASALNALDRADSALVRAAAADPAWAEPMIQRAWVARQRAYTMFRLPDVQGSPSEVLLRGIQHATAALDLKADDARAYEVRGVLRDTYATLVPMPDSATHRKLVQDAESDLGLAEELDPSLSNALNVLGSIQASRGENEQARITTERAYRADYYAQSREVIYRLFNTTFEIGDDAAASQWCSLIGRRFADDWVPTYCTLMLMTWSPGERPDVSEAQQLVARTVPAIPEVTRGETSAQLELLVAGVAARALPADSAMRVLEGTRARIAADSVLMRDPNSIHQLLRFEAMVWMRLGERDRASELLARYLERSPDDRLALSRSRIFESLFEGTRLRTEIQRSSSSGPQQTSFVPTQ